jgi:hypothetical protein
MGWIAIELTEELLCIGFEGVQDSALMTVGDASTQHAKEMI